MHWLRHWKVKGIVQKVLSIVPGGSSLNDLLQQRLGDLRDFDDNIRIKVDNWCGLMSYLGKVGASNMESREIMEIGSGWYPTVPVCFALAGTRFCHTVDISRHMNWEQTARMLRAVGKHLDRIAALSGRPAATVRAVFEELLQAQNLDDLLSRAGIVYHAPADGSRADWLATGTLDLVYSNSVLEHVPGPVIAALMRESHRVLKPDGLMLHAVACNDHYAHFDKSISFVNYLQFGERQWCFWNNPLNYQNRLRASDFVEFAHNAGFELIHESRAVRPGTREGLARLRIASEFAAYAPEDLIATTIDFVARKKR
jgi:SAM-dependent methyltransferase